MIAATDFSLCIRRPESCSRHADCARAQFGTRNPQRQAFVAPTLTGDACSIFFDFAPFRQLAANGGGIADTLGASENLGPAAQSHAGAESRETSGASEAPAISNNFGAARSARAVGQQPIGTATNATPRPAPSFSAGNGVACGVGRAGGAGLAGPSGSALDANEREQLHAARTLKL